MYVVFKILFEKEGEEYILWAESWESWFVFSGSSSSIGGLVALCLRICCLNSSLELLDTDTELQKMEKSPIKTDEWSPNSVKVHLWNILQTVRKSRIITGQNRSPIFLICDAKNVVENYGTRIEILHGHPFEGWTKRARPSHPFWQKLAELLKSGQNKKDQKKF